MSCSPINCCGAHKVDPNAVNVLSQLAKGKELEMWPQNTMTRCKKKTVRPVYLPISNAVQRESYWF